MKICCIGFDLPEGKVKYQDELVITLDQKLSPKKITPFYVEFTRDDFSHCDGFLVAREKIWDLLILDLEKLEARRDRSRGGGGTRASGQVPGISGAGSAAVRRRLHRGGTDPLEDPGPLEFKAHGGRRRGAGAQ